MYAANAFYKTCYSALEDPETHGQMVLPLISFNPPTRPTTSRYSQIDSQMFLGSILKEVDTQAEKFFTKFISPHLDISTF